MFDYNYSSYRLQTGTIIYCDPVSRRYEVSLDGEDAETAQRSALDLGAPTAGYHRTGTAQGYKESDRVLLAVPSSDIVRWCYILGLVCIAEYMLDAEAPRTVNYPLNAVLSSFETEASYELLDMAPNLPDSSGEPLKDSTLCTSLKDSVADYIQLGTAFDGKPVSFQGTLPADTGTGSYTISGRHTVLSADAYKLKLQAGSAITIMDSLFGNIINTAITEQSYTAVSETTEKITAPYSEYVERRTIDYREGTDTVEDKRHYNFTRIISPYVYGDISITYSSDAYKPVSAIHKRLDGVVAIQAVNGVSIEKRFSIPGVYVKSPTTIQPSPVPESTFNACKSYKELLEKLNNNTGDKLEIDEPLSELEEAEHILDAPSADEGIKLPGDKEFFSDNVLADVREYIDALSCIKTLPTGGILIRDAWGSEIRMEGGNIQISAANNITNVAGRDMLDIVSGVRAVSASEEVQIGAKNRNVILHGKQVKVDGSDAAVILGNNVEIIGKDQVNTTAATILSKSSQDTVIAAEKGAAILTGMKTQVVGSGAVTIASRSTAIVAADKIYTGSIEIHGYTYIMRENLEVEGITLPDYTISDLTVAGGTATLSVAGQIWSGGLIKSNSAIEAKGAMTCDTIASKGNGDGKVRSIKGTIPSVNIPGDFKKIDGSTPSSIATMKNRLKDITDKLPTLKKVFEISSKAYTIWQPLFSKLKGAKPVSAAVEKARKDAYIYPGKSFWTGSDSLVVNASDSMELPVEGLEFKSVSSMKLGEANIKED